MESIRDVDPISPVAPWQGGKRNLAKRLVERIEAIPHITYAEPFVGMGGVFLRRRRAPRAEAINDYSRDVATFFRILQRHYVPFMEMMRFQLTTRAEFERLARTDPDTLTDLERAARFLYLQRTTFGGKVKARSFGVSPANAARFDVTRLGPMLEDLHARLAGVVIECLPWPDFIRRYDREGTLFYCDPPYWGCEDDYGKEMFENGDFTALSEALKALQGQFILSINDVPEIRELFAWAEIETVETTYTVGGGKKAKKVGELIIAGALCLADPNQAPQ